MLEQADFKIKNYMEAVVLQNIDEILQGCDNICKCELCRRDIIALTLNELPPRYVVTELGETYIKTQSLDHQFRADLFAAISKAVNIVKDNPRYGHNKT